MLTSVHNSIDVGNVYTCLKQYKDADGYDYIVMFTKPNTGVIVSNQIDLVNIGPQFEIGYFYDHFKEDMFTPFHGTITITA